MVSNFKVTLKKLFLFFDLRVCCFENAAYIVQTLILFSSSNSTFIFLKVGSKYKYFGDAVNAIA